MISLTVAKKYARAFLKINLPEGNYEALGKDLEKVVDLLKENKELKGVLFSSVYPGATRKAVASEINQILGLSKIAIDFINLLIERERIDHLPEIVQSYRNLCDEVSGRIRANLVTALDLSPELVSAIKNQLESTTGKKVILSVQKDPTLIGGVLAKIENVIYDGSLKTQLLRTRKNLYKE